MIKVGQCVWVLVHIGDFGIIFVGGLLVVECPGGLTVVCPAQISRVGGDVICFKAGGLEAIRCNFNCDIINIGRTTVVTLAFENNIDCSCHHDGGGLIVVPPRG